MMPQNITVIGTGAMATVCGITLANKGYRIALWGSSPSQVEQLNHDRENKRFLPGHRIPPDVHITADASKAFLNADLVISAVPCQYLRGVWERLVPFYSPDAPICSVTKGIENETLLRPSETLVDVIGSVEVAVLSGPSIAEELARCLPATVTVASTSESLAQRIQTVFTTHWFRVYTNKDLVGVELAGATKNVIALAAGILDGLQAGDNAKAALLTRGLVEITRLGEAMGARRETFNGLAGLGDLVTTCVSPHGRNRRCGEMIGRGQKLKDVLESTESVVEGVATTKSVVALARRNGVEMPITEAVHSVLFDDKDAIDAITELMLRQPKQED
jgi:glycerol-3-phosphate dehydrogenase (NAD(P)+)